ncbi:menaquinone biosynthesis family protein [Helicobacter canis]|uniref:1,4-dihydroxy-6-naphtoate synthase n=1 Tax=Helicobacter canis NCTC 12740 TaxID=1357399 RepID=V8CHN4_9HELI|nr:MqnA/MqnD/SBP family protein [Helicobacter canis]ETD26592.1 hypothetical protein HMPREF2087_00975 [Helicobacter canis NCTC 12740]
MISVAHSPDADDIFMYYAIAFGWVDSKLGLQFCNTALDIQTLNEAALQGSYDVSAISFGVYPLIAQDYALLRTGVSFGSGYGPKLIKLKGKQLKPHCKVALSGAHTTNALLFRIAYPNAKIVYKNFLDIESAVLNGEVDAGVLIHESILTFSDQLEVEREIWDIWCELAGDELPLPLGGMALRRSIPLLRAIDIESTLTKAVQIATQNKPLLSTMLLNRNLIRVNAKELETYLNLYANADSISLSPVQKQAIDTLFSLLHKAGFYPKALCCEEFLLPREYAELRDS